MTKKHSAKGGPAFSRQKNTQVLQENKLSIEIEELKNGWQRTQADFENFKKRMEAERLDNLALSKAEFVLQLVPILDNFKRAFENVPPKERNNLLILGFKQIEKQLDDLLTLEGLKKIPAEKGQKFDPHLHDAVSYENNSGIPADHIIAELESGWMFQDQIIEPAKVRVSKGNKNRT